MQILFNSATRHAWMTIFQHSFAYSTINFYFKDFFSPGNQHSNTFSSNERTKNVTVLGERNTFRFIFPCSFPRSAATGHSIFPSSFAGSPFIWKYSWRTNNIVARSQDPSGSWRDAFKNVFYNSTMWRAGRAYWFLRGKRGKCGEVATTTGNW